VAPAKRIAGSFLDRIEPQVLFATQSQCCKAVETSLTEGIISLILLLICIRKSLHAKQAVMFKHLRPLSILLFLIIVAAGKATSRANSHEAQPFGAADSTGYEKALYLENGDTLPYRILFPENYDRTKKYPLVLFLHGAGERGSDNEKQLVHGSSLFLKEENRKNFPCIVIFPQCPAAGFWASVEVDRSVRPLKFEFNYRGSDITPSLRLAMGLTRSVIKQEAVDPDRVYVTGLSMGGMGTFEAVWREPELFAAAAPICGGGDAGAYKRAAARVPFWIFHGASDSVVGVDLSRVMVARLKKFRAAVRYSEYPGVDHNSWDNAFAEQDFLSWMFSQRR
jgi:predicted peptidase